MRSIRFVAVLLVFLRFGSWGSQALAAENIAIGPDKPNSWAYGVRGVMEKADVPYYDQEFGEDFKRETNGNISDPRFFSAFLGSRSDAVQRKYDKSVLEEIELNEVELPDLDILTSVPRLREVSIVGSSSKFLSQEMLNALATDASLCRVTLRGNVSSLDLSVLKRLRKLSYIRLMEPCLTVKNVRQLAELQSLRCFYLEYCNSSKEALPELGILQNIEELRLTVGEIPGGDFSFLKRLTNLRVLQLGVVTDDQALEQISHLQGLEWLSNPPQTDADVRVLANLKNLRTLELSGRSLTDETLGLLQGTHLRYLSVQECSARGFRNLDQLPDLRGLDLSWSDVTDEQLMSLRNLTNLRRLRLDCIGCSHPNEVAKALSVQLPQCAIQGNLNCRRHGNH